MEQFMIEIAQDGSGRNFNINALGMQQYEIFEGEARVGTIEIDGENHEHCKAVDCEIDLPLMNSIREAILLHNILST